ncbi:MAG: hypothetical protein NTZ74_09395 [Chloroflexi bacterium]|nr:hypothetical protein [Chloroflexota bacterium]
MVVKTLELANGKHIGMAIAEVTAIPFYELYDKDKERANNMNQVLFSQLISSFHRKSDANYTALELLWQSVAVDNQTYKAQVKLFIIVRKIGTEVKSVIDSVENMMQSIKNELEDKNFVTSVFESDDEFDDFERFSGQVNTVKALSVTKREKAVVNTMSVNGWTYYNDVLFPDENLNTVSISNALTQYPNSAISMQIIPTAYTAQEIIAIEESKNFLNHYVSNVKYMQGIRVDANTQMIVDAYDYYSNANNEQLFYYNFVIYSLPNDVLDLANKLIDAMEVDDKSTASGLEITDVSSFGLSPTFNLFATPWQINEILVYKAREQRFWGTKNAPQQFIRFKQLITARELRSVFKFPIDDGKTIGLGVKKVISNREKLHKSIISEGNFKVGIIQNASKSSGGNTAHAGIALNDFTKHGLIVGMPGSGKTNFSLGLLLQFWNDFKIPFLAIEPTKSEYRSLIDGISDLQIFTPGKSNVSPYIINPFLPPKGVTVESYVPSLMTAFKAAFSMPNPLPDIFLASINECYNEYGWKSDSTVEDATVQKFGLYEFIKVFKRRIKCMDYNSEVKANMESAGVVRLVSLIEQNSSIYDNIHTIPIEELLQKPTVIELNAINNKEQKSLIMALLLILICVYTKNNVAGDGKLKNVMLIDEAHVLLAGGGTKGEDSADSQSSTIEALEDMIAEIRSYGTSIIIADQSPTKVGRSIVANTNVKIIFKLVEKENKDAIATATNMTEADYEILGRLDIGEAMLHYGRVNTPLHIKTYNVLDRAKIRPVISDTEIAILSNYWQGHADLLIPHIECAYNSECLKDCDFKVRNDADFLATRLKNSLLPRVHDRVEFIKILQGLGTYLKELLSENPNILFNWRLFNCVKIKFLRKVMLEKDFGISKTDYRKILENSKFLKRTEGGAVNE